MAANRHMERGSTRVIWQQLTVRSNLRIIEGLESVLASGSSLAQGSNTRLAIFLPMILSPSSTAQLFGNIILAM